jgi:hypothetical protein
LSSFGRIETANYQNRLKRRSMIFGWKNVP